MLPTRLLALLRPANAPTPAFVPVAPRGRAARRAAAIAAAIEPLETRSLFSVATWTGAVDIYWSTPANWANNTVPVAGDDLVFAQNPSHTESVNDLPGGTHFQSMTIEGSGYDLYGNPLAIDGGVTATYAAGSSALGMDVTLGTGPSFDVAAGGRLDVTASVDGTQSLSKSGGGTLALSGSNTYSGGTSIADGVVVVTASDALGTGAVSISYPGELDLAGGVTLSNAVTNYSSGTGIRNVSGDNELAGSVTFAQSATIDVANGSSLTVSGTIGQTVTSRTLTKTGGGLLQVDTASTYTGGTDLRTGTIKVMNDRSLGTSGLIYVETGATLLLASPTFSAPSGGIYMGGNITPSTIATAAGDATDHTLNGQVNLLGNARFDVRGSGALTVSGNVAGSGTVRATATSAGTLVLAGTSSYAGRTYVDGGTVRVDGNFSSSSELDVSGGTLGGTGTVGAVVGTGGTVRAGTGSTGSLQTGNLSLNAAATFAARLNGTTAGSGYDQTVVAGTVSLGGAALSVSLGYTPAYGDTFRLINNDGSDPVSGTFAGLPEGSTFTAGGSAFLVSYVGGDGNDVTLTAVATSTTTVAASPTPSTYGQSVTFTVTVASAGPTPTGSVTLLVDGGAAGTATVDGAGQATVTISTLGTGGHTVAATYAGDGAVAPSASATGSHTVNAATTTTTLGSSALTSRYGQTVTFTATVTADAPGGGTPSGTVTFYDGSTLMGTGTLNGSGVATLSTSGLDVGSHTISAEYGGTGDYDVSQDTVSQTVGQAVTTAVVGTTPSSAVYAEPVTLTAQVSVTAPGNGTPAGTVAFYDGTTLIGTAALDGTGAASLTGVGFGVGTHGLTVAYAGDTSFQSVTSPVHNLVVGEGPVVVQVSASPTPSRFGQPVVMTATVAATGGAVGTPSGQVSFYDGTTLLGTATLDGAGEATLTVPLTAVGVRSVTAHYDGDGNFAAGTSPAHTPTVAAADTTVALDTSAAASRVGQSVTFTATVSVVAPGAGTATGVVRFYDGPTLLGTVAVDGAGEAALSTSGLSLGDHAITATYGGDASFAASTSGGLTQSVVNQVPTAGTVTVTRLPGAAATVDVLAAAADADGDALTASLLSGPAHGTVSLDAGVFHYTPAAGAHGPDSFQYTLDDGHGGTATGTATVNLAGVGLDDSPTAAGLTDLVAVGTGANDVITFTGLSGRRVRVTVNGSTVGTYTPTGRLIAYGLGGNDVLTARNVGLGALFYGGDGNDVLTGGRKRDLLVGGDGNDTIRGTGGGDLLVGGNGRDVLRGGSSDDLLVAGTTAWDDAYTDGNRASLETLLASWRRPRSGHGHSVAAGPADTSTIAAGVVTPDADADDLRDRSGKNWLIGDSTGALDLLRVGP
ncbi:MAG TPA: Ig-like domain repeat protein, partial [Humisphaera sp.]